MKKRFWFLILSMIAVLGMTSLLMACEDVEKADYAVTVLSPDESPLSGITVSWSAGNKQEGSAVTGEDGKATASLPVGTYSVALSGYGEGLEYTAVSVSSSMRNITLTLQVEQVQYSAAVTDKTGAPAKGVTVSWLDGNSPVGSAVTDEEGKAVCKIPYGDYTVTVANLPDGNIFDDTLSATGAAPAVQIELRDGINYTYRVTVKSEGGLLFGKQAMMAFKGSNTAASGYTDENGVFTFSAVSGEYAVRAVALPAGYTCVDAQLTDGVREGEVTLRSAVIMAEPAAGTAYVMGDIIHNYSFTTPYEVDGKQLSYTIADILKTKDAVLINNWGTNCSWCVQEMPAMQEAYNKYKDRIEMLAVSNYQGGDSDNAVAAYHERYGYTFPMMRDTNGFASKFPITGWPTTIVIDRYGAVARIESGAVLDAEVWGRMIEKYIGKDYVQTFTPGTHESDSITTEIAKPDVVVPADHYEKVAATLHRTETFPAGTSIVWRGEAEYEMAWPFVLGTVPDVSPDEQVLYSSNSGKANSMSIIYATVTVEPGKVLTFDYYAQTQASDILSVVWDGKIIKQIYGDSNGWQTCYLYSEITSGSHSLGMTYIKDGSGNVGKDNVYLRNVRFTDLAQITESTDMLRAAAYGVPEKDATKYPHYATTEIAADGYYHVTLSALENARYAGNDNSPLLLVNLLNVTNWLGNSIGNLVYMKDEGSGEYLYDCTFTIDEVTRDYREDLVGYLHLASSSDIADCIPVDKELHDLLVAFMARVSGEKSHADEWLEACYFYSHYGSGDPVGNPIIGLSEKTAIAVTADTAVTADVTRNMNPFPYTIYSFTPATDGVYKIESFVPDNLSEQYATQVWLYDDTSSMDKPLVHNGESRFNRDGKNEQNFEVYRYMTAGHKYYLAVAFLMSERGTFDFSVTNVGQSATTLLPCSANLYSYEEDESGKPTDGLKLLGAVQYEKDEDGYFRVKNADGTQGGYIYFDVKYPTALTMYSISDLADQYQRDPETYKNLDYKVFDFRYRVAYYNQGTGDNAIVVYDPKFDMTKAEGDEFMAGRVFKDYTDIIKGYIAAAETEGENAGLVKVDQQLVDILTLFMEMRINMLLDNVYELALDNEWLRFCWYYRTYDSDHI